MTKDSKDHASNKGQCVSDKAKKKKKKKSVGGYYKGDVSSGQNSGKYCGYSVNLKPAVLPGTN